MRYPCQGKWHNKIIIFYLRPIASTDAPARRRGDACIQVLECRSIVAHYLHNIIILLTKEDGDKIITTTMSAALMSCSIIINNVRQDKVSQIVTLRVRCISSSFDCEEQNRYRKPIDQRYLLLLL